MPSPNAIPNFRAEPPGAAPNFSRWVVGGTPGMVHCWRTAANSRRQRMRRMATWKSSKSVLIIAIPEPWQPPLWQIGWTPVRWTSWTSTMQWWRPLGLTLSEFWHFQSSDIVRMKRHKISSNPCYYLFLTSLPLNHASPWVPHRLIILLIKMPVEPFVKGLSFDFVISYIYIYIHWLSTFKYDMIWHDKTNKMMIRR